jgi:two-component system cell cycle sensor histidine kinase/response regulator CckA
VVYGIVRQGDGHLFVESAPGTGATFGVLLPVAPSRASEPVRAARSTPEVGGARILLVEDEDMIREVARRFLEQAGHRVVEAASGREALDRFARSEEAFDLLLTDVVMPGMGGLALARALRESAPGLRVLYMSGYAQELAGPGALDARGAPFLPKPFDAAALTSAVAAALAAPAGTGR